MHFNHPSDRDSLSDAIDELKEFFVATISDLQASVTALTAAVAAVENAPTKLDAADQAVVDSIAAELAAAVTALDAIVTPPVVQPPPVA
jgi:hypothetical protein